MSQKFTLSDALVIQQVHLAEWRRVLKPAMYAKLEQYCKECNLKTKRAQSVVRGTRLYEFVANRLMRNSDWPSSETFTDE